MQHLISGYFPPFLLALARRPSLNRDKKKGKLIRFSENCVERVDGRPMSCVCLAWNYSNWYYNFTILIHPQGRRPDSLDVPESARGELQSLGNYPEVLAVREMPDCWCNFDNLFQPRQRRAMCSWVEAGAERRKGFPPRRSTRRRATTKGRKRKLFSCFITEIIKSFSPLFAGGEAREAFCLRL